MKTILSSLFCFLFVFGLATDVSAYMKIGDIKGETTDDRSASSSSTAAVQVRATTGSSSSEDDDDDDRGDDDDRTSRSSSSVTREVTTDPEEGVEPDEIDYDDSSSSAAQTQGTASSASSKSGTKKGNVEYEWKVEEGESMEASSSSVGTVQTQPQEGVEPDEIDARNAQKDEEEDDDDDMDLDDNEGPQETNFALLLDSGNGGGNDDEEEDEETTEEHQRIANILLQGAQEENVPMEELSLNYEKIKAKVKHDVKLFGFIPVTVHPTVEIDAYARAKVKFPWWAFLASGKQSDAIGEAVRDVLSTIIEEQFR